MAILNKLEQTIQKFKMLKSGEQVVAAVSGGPDSVALVHLLNKLSQKWPGRIHLHLAHFNHLLRKESTSDSAFVENLARRLKLPFSCESIKVKDFAQKEKLSIEQAARTLRYNFLSKVAREHNASKIALGHTWDDQAETVLMRFLRGSGISGLRGIPATRRLNNCLIIRPLIELKRVELLHFLRSKNISFRCDSSNLEDIYLRNRIRHKLLPILEESFNANIKELLVNLAENLSVDFDLLQKMAAESFPAVCTSSNGQTVKLNIKKFLRLHQSLQKLVIRQAIKKLKGSLPRLDYRHWKELEDLVETRPKNSIVDLPAGLSVKKGKRIVFYKRDSIKRLAQVGKI